MTETDEEPTAELAANIAVTARALLRVGSVNETLRAVVGLAVETIEGCEFAGIFVQEDGRVSTPVCTDPIVVRVDALQHLHGEGPCLDAVLKGGVFYSGDLGEDDRWPLFGPDAAGVGMRSLLALQLTGDGTFGALNLYTRLPLAFGIIDRAKAVIFATLASVALDAAKAHELEQLQLEQLQQALATRELIGQAQGILMERERITSDQAFDILRRASQNLNVKLREVAHDLVETGALPERPEPETPLARA
jgi:hypothetical protein